MICCNKRRLFVDIETHSSVDIAKAGAFKYIESDDFEIILLAYAWDYEPVQIIEMHKLDEYDEDYDQTQDRMLRAVIDGLLDSEIVKVAHNTAFERAALSKVLCRNLPPEEWEDTMIMAAMNGLPQSLDACGAALQLTDQKLKEGKLLINYFCKPCKPTLSNGGRTRNHPEHAPDKWQRFVDYCVRDVEVCQQIHKRLASYPVTDFEREVWALDARMNERGVQISKELAEAAVSIDTQLREKHLAEMKQLTGLENPNSVAQLKEWLEAVGIQVDSINKATIKDLLATTKDPTVRRVLELRQLLGKTSTKKYEAMLSAVCKDERIKGLLQYYGAARTGRWAGRLVQVQNLPQNHLDQIDKVRELVQAEDIESLELVFDSISDVLSQLIRTAFVAKDGHTFLVADYSAIEARVIAYLAGEQWRLDTFAQGGDIYCSSASQMFGVPVEKHGVNKHLRQKGKIAELACGYGGGVSALKAFGADKMGLTEDEMQNIVTQWRAASPTIPRLWRGVESAAKQALKVPGMRCSVITGNAGRFVCTYWRDGNALRCELPSGRVLSYWGARLDNDGSVCFMGQNQTTRKWEKTQTWGGRLVENIVQAFARDCLAVAMTRLDAAGYRIVFHVHDELIAEAPVGSRWQDMAEIMALPIDWAPGLLLPADGYETPFYMKD